MFEWPVPGQRLDHVIAGPVGDLQARLASPAQGHAGVAVVCHPHPQHGGTMDNKVVHTLSRACLEVGYRTLCFNFRGVGDSQGGYDEGRGETQDALAIVDWALQHGQTDRLLLAGFSFGSAVALRAAAQRPAAGLVTVALPIRYFRAELPRPDCRWQAVYGSADEIVDTPAAIRRLGHASPSPTVEVLEGAGHFFHGRLTELRRHVVVFLSGLAGTAG